MKKILLVSLLAVFIMVPPISAGDFDGDGTDDVAIFRPLSGLWAVRGSTRVYFGAAGDYPVSGDFNGDGMVEAAVFRPTSGLWAVRGITRAYFGGMDDIPVSGDYNGDGTDDTGIYRSTASLWAVRGITRIYFGASDDIPVPADYSGTGTTEAGIFRESNGLWVIRSVTRAYFGAYSDLPVPSDYNGDGLHDIGIFRSSSGLWAVRGVTRSYLGAAGDLPQPLDCTGDGTDRIGIFRPAAGLWAIKGTSRIYYGGSQDLPIAAPRYWSTPDLPAFGIEIKSRHQDDAHFDKLIQAGAATTRYGYLSWAQLEPTNTTADNYHWEKYDQIMMEYGERGLTAIVIIADIPSWAGEYRSGPFDDASRDDFAEFVGAVVSRYSRPPYNIKHWELFNEPDGTKQGDGAGVASWGYFGKEYALMLKEAYPAIKAADPESRLAMGGLAYDGFVEDGGIFYRHFLADVLKNGGGGYFDIMNFHYYYFARADWGGSIIGKIDSLKDVLASYGITKPMICTEVGIWGDEYRLSIQARYVPQVYARGLSAGLGTILWFPLSTNAGSSFEGGLLREEDLSAKPAYISYQTMTTELGGYKYSAIIETGSGNLECYVFASSTTGKNKYVIWAEEETSGYIGFTYESIRVVAIDGSVRFITDGGAGDLDGSDNGQITIAITPSPIYVESW